MKQLIEHLKKLPKDHLLHFTASLLLAWAATVACAMLLPDGKHKIDSAAIGFIAAMAVGVWKELYDGTFSGRDFVADIAGAFTGTAMYLIAILL